MEQFLITYVPPLVVLLSLLVTFVWMGRPERRPSERSGKSQ